MPSDIPFIRPSFPAPEAIASDYAEILASNWFTNFGPKERALSAGMATLIGDVSVTTTANGTLALLAALHETVGAGQGDSYVLVPAFTFIAAAQSIVWTGHRPLFLDVDPVTWQPALSSAREALATADRPVVGILLANVFGVGNPEVAEWEQLAAAHGVPLVIDSAAGFGSWYDESRRVGSRGTCEIFSLHATKPFGIGEGGAVASRDAELIAAVDRFSNFGFDAHRSSASLGLNAKLPELSAAIGLRQLVDLDARLEDRRKVSATYGAALQAHGFEQQVNAERSSLCFASLRSRSAAHKEAAMRQLAAHGVDARDYYNPPLHRHPYFSLGGQPFAATDLSATEDLCRRIISVPIHDRMSASDVDRVITALSAEELTR